MEQFARMCSAGLLRAEGGPPSVKELLLADSNYILLCRQSDG